MSKKIYGQIRVKGELSDYIKGRITGIICGVVWRDDVEYKPYATLNFNGDTFFRVECTKKQFEKISKIIDWTYSKMYEINFIEL